MREVLRFLLALIFARRVRPGADPGRAMVAVYAGFRIPEGLSDREAMGKALDALRARFPDLRILLRSRGEMVLEFGDRPGALLLRVDPLPEGPDEEARYLFVRQVGAMALGELAGPEDFIRDLSGVFRELHGRSFPQASFALEIRFPGRDGRTDGVRTEAGATTGQARVEAYADRLVVRARDPSAWEQAAVRCLRLAG